ncbi:MAG: alpha/beta hydrolase [Flavobacteriales bacterium]|nr:alpha/beta hydrolase [Flavobacteriales bacterium]
MVPSKHSLLHGEFSEKYNKNGDSIKVLDTINFQPEFFDKNNNRIDLPYSIKSFIINSKSGNALNAWEISNDSVYNGKNLIFFHGNAGSLITQHKSMLPFVKAGYKAYMIDYSGFGFSSGKATRSNVLLDGISAVEKFTRLDTTAKWIIYGQSLGGHLTPVVALETQKEIDGIVVEGAFTSHQDIGANTAGFIARILIAEKYSGVKAISKFNKPVLIIHSTEDEIIPYRMGEELFKEANSPKQFMKIDKCHICGPMYYSAPILQKMEELF